MAVELGSMIKQTRKAGHLTQKQLAAGICSQPMLSAIEQGQYTPNAKLLLALCKRLGISLDEISLSANFDISATTNLNQKLDRLCNAHRYQELLDFLQADDVLDHIETDAQMQAYYYYLGVSKWHLQDDIQTVETDFQLSLANAHPNQLSVLTRLGLASTGIIKAQLGYVRAVEKLFDQALLGIEKAAYEENLNAIFYLAGMSYFELKQYPQVTNWLVKGIDFATVHNSHYMLANIYYLLAKTADIEGQKDLSDDAHRRSEIFVELFNEKPYEKF